MPLLNFGQPADGVMQMSYVVKDIHQAIQHWISKLHVGPWFLLEHFTAERPVYRGRQSTASADVDADIKRYEAMGLELAFRAGVPTGGDVAYMDTHGTMPGFVELIATNPLMEQVFGRFYGAALSWDGSDPIRPFV